MPTVKELKQQCRERGLKGYSKQNKAGLMKMLHPKKGVTHHTKSQLMKICRANGVSGYSNKSKSWLEGQCFTKRSD